MVVGLVGSRVLHDECSGVECENDLNSRTLLIALHQCNQGGVSRDTADKAQSKIIFGEPFTFKKIAMPFVSQKHKKQKGVPRSPRVTLPAVRPRGGLLYTMRSMPIVVTV